MSGIREIVTNEQRKQLRKVKNGQLFDVARNTLNSGITSRGLSEAYVQFGQDVRLYGLWEAMLYAEGYENSGEYAAGVVMKAMQAVLKAMVSQSDLVSC